MVSALFFSQLVLIALVLMAFPQTAQEGAAIITRQPWIHDRSGGLKGCAHVPRYARLALKR